MTFSYTQGGISGVRAFLLEFDDRLMGMEDALKDFQQRDGIQVTNDERWEEGKYQQYPVRFLR